MRSLLQDFTSVIFDAFDRAADYLLGNDARFQYLRIIPSQMQPARRASSVQVMFLPWLTNLTISRSGPLISRSSRASCFCTLV
jgi:hypothetical protein